MARRWRGGPVSNATVGALLALFALLVGACGGSSPPVVRPPTSSASSSTTSMPTTTSVPTTSSSAPAPTGKPQITVSPRIGLGASTVVQVEGSGFSPNEALVVNECAAKGTATGPGDCNLAGLVAVTSNGRGEISVRFHVIKGPFGANRVICGPAQRCLVSVSQASPSPTEEADVEITFA